MEQSKQAMEMAKKLAQSDTGKQLYELLQKNQGQQLNTVMEQAAAGDFEQVKKAMRSFMKDPQARALLEKLGR